MPGIGDIGGLVGLCNQGSSGIVGDLNNICQPSLPQPEQATGGINAMVQPPGAPGVGTAGGKTLYDNYGVAGQFWAAHGLQCSDMTSLIGNNVAGMVFDAAKSIDRVTITVYQSAAGNNILTWLQDAVDRLITALGNAIYFPYLAPVVILGAIWLAWQGLIRKRLKLGFLLLLLAGPFFLIIGTHPGFGRVIAVRWFEMLVGVLMKSAAVAIVLSVLLYCYSLIMGTADAVLPWALKILMIALVTVAVFIYRKPFSHLFSAVGYGTLGSTERAEYSLREAGHTFRRSTLDAARPAGPAGPTGPAKPVAAA